VKHLEPIDIFRNSNGFAKQLESSVWTLSQR
jgi:hypothetical protein